MRSRFALYLLASLVLLIVDGFTPLESVEWILNVVLVWFVSLHGSPAELYMAGVVSSFCIFLGAVLSPASLSPGWLLLTNRAVTVGTIWLMIRFSLQRAAAEKREDLARRALAESNQEIKILRGIIPICSWCKRIRNDSGAWEQMEVYISKHSEADFSHGICEECLLHQSKDFEPKTSGM